MLAAGQGVAAAPVSRPAPAFHRRGWIQSPGWDAFWMFSALWGCALVLLGWAVAPVLAAVVALLAFERVVSVLHAWSTTTMVLASPLLAEERRADPRRYRIVPAVIAAISFALGVAVAASWAGAESGSVALLALYVGLFWVGHFWHFGAQDFGVLTLYREKAGQKRLVERRVDKLYTVVMMYAVQPAVYVTVSATTFFPELARSVLSISEPMAHAVARGALAVAALLTAGVAAYELAKPNRSLPKLLYVLVIFLHPTLLYAAALAGQRKLAFLYLFAYLWSHWFIAIGLVGRINTRYYESRGDSAFSSVVRHAALLLLVAGVVFLLTERHFDYLIFYTDGDRVRALLRAITPGETVVVGLVMGFFLCEQLLHYYCDRCLFRFRDPAIRRRVAPLVLGGAPQR